MLRPETVASVQAQAAELNWPVSFCDLDPNDYEAYWRVLTEWWERGQDFLVVEHDVEPVAGTFSSMDECPSTWCSSPYEIDTGVKVLALGCTRFRSELMEAYPEALRDAGEIQNDSVSLPKRHYKRLDTRIASVLHAKRYHCHAHIPAVHHHDYREPRRERR